MGPPRSPALAIGWEFRRRHRWGLTALAGYLVVLAALKLVLVVRGLPVALETPERFAAVIMVPLTATFTYVLAAFSFGLSGDLAARRSMYPARLFTLPVTTAALAGWPMLYGSAAMALLWLATRLFALWPPGMHVPFVWPALGAASLLAWTQALTWMPYGLPGLRVVVAVLWLGTIDTGALLALQFKVGEPMMLAILAPHLPLAYLTARVAVARARRGEVPDWRGAFARIGPLASARPGVGARFRSAGAAHAWFEWRRHGWSLPAMVGIVLPFELALLFVARDTPALVWEILLGVLLTPAFLAAFVAARVRRPDPDAPDPTGLTPFLATRPMTGAALVAAKLKATLWSALVAWLLVLVAVPTALAWSGTWPTVLDRAARIVQAVGTPHAIGFALLALVGCVAFTWMQLVQGLAVGLAGRGWLMKASVFATLTGLAAIGPMALWVADHRAVAAALWHGFPLVLGVLICLKLSAAVWVAGRLVHGRVLSDRALVAGAAWWCAAVLALYAALAWLFFTPFFPRYLLGLVAILTVPLARVAATPLAVAWDRHR